MCLEVLFGTCSPLFYGVWLETGAAIMKRFFICMMTILKFDVY